MSNYDLKILKLAEKQNIKSSDVSRLLRDSISRQQIHSILSQLVADKKLIKTGSTRYTIYIHPSNLAHLNQIFSSTINNQNLSDEAIYQKIIKTSGLLDDMPANFTKIAHYAVTEMLNNAIEHSHSKKIIVSVSKASRKIEFTIWDRGVGVYNNVKLDRHLSSDLEAIQDLLKGKTTTAKHGHSGEGIFFTSKAVDQFILESYGTKLQVDNNISDYTIEKTTKSYKGTKVTLVIDLDTTVVLRAIFDQYVTSPGEVGFDKTSIKIKLYEEGVDYVSRSQARRVIEDLNKFKTIILDFDKVTNIGQAFADEIFRVFKANYPNITIQPINTVEPVQFMIDRVEKP